MTAGHAETNRECDPSGRGLSPPVLGQPIMPGNGTGQARPLRIVSLEASTRRRRFADAQGTGVVGDGLVPSRCQAASLSGAGDHKGRPYDFVAEFNGLWACSIRILGSRRELELRSGAKALARAQDGAGVVRVVRRIGKLLGLEA